jgi:hypothetical protein
LRRFGAMPKRASGMSINPLLAALDEVLEQGEALLTGLSDAQYSDTEGGGLSASIGAHYRHSLEHFKRLFEAVPEGLVDYDRRERDARLEGERLLALNVTRDLRQAARFLAALPADRPIEARYCISYETLASASALSTLGREIMYAVSHAVHHYALIGLICGLRNIALPDDFGIAPSTIAYRGALETARRLA